MSRNGFEPAVQEFEFPVVDLAEYNLIDPPFNDGFDGREPGGVSPRGMQRLKAALVVGVSILSLAVLDQNTVTQAEKAETFDRQGLSLEDIHGASPVEQDTPRETRRVRRITKLQEYDLAGVSADDMAVLEGAPEITADGETTGGFFDWFSRFSHWRRATTGDVGGDDEEALLGSSPVNLENIRQLDLTAEPFTETCESFNADSGMQDDNDISNRLGIVNWAISPEHTIDEFTIVREGGNGNRPQVFIEVCFRPNGHQDEETAHIYFQEPGTVELG